MTGPHPLSAPLTLRFDMRAPSFAAPDADLYATAIEMCTWSESRGASVAVLSEHHATDDHHLPAPLVLASAVAARTERLAIMLAAVVLPLYEPVRLAEEMAVLDIISRGRVGYVFGVGHRREEYDHFGVEHGARGRLADENLDLVLRLLHGETVADGSRTARLSPPPLTPGGPVVMIGGGSVAAARRAGRHGLGLLAQSAPPGLQDAYEAACRAAGHEVGWAQLPDPGAPTAVFVAADVDQAWRELGPYLLHDAKMAASYRHGGGEVASISGAGTVEELRDEGGAYRVVTLGEAEEMIRTAGRLPLAPLCGGLWPSVAWPYLERAAEAARRARL